MPTYSNDLRLKEITTGDEDGTWGISTNTNLSLIADAFSLGTKQMAANADETFTMPDATADGTRALYLKITSAVSLTATRTVTLAPNTVSKVWIIENATSGSQSITIKQGSGATVTVATGAIAMVVSDGAGAGAAVTNATPTASGTLPVANGGTGATTLTANNVILGNGTSAVGFVAPSTAGNLLTSNGSTWTSAAAPAGSAILRVARTSNTAIAVGNKSNLIDITSGTFTQTFNSCASLGSGFFCYIRNSGTGDITLDPDASETIDGLASYVMYPNEVRLVQCDGSALRTIVLVGFSRTFTSSATVTIPPGYNNFGGYIWGGGGGGARGGVDSQGNGYFSGGGGGGACAPFTLPSSLFGASISYTQGAGGSAGASAGTAGTAGGNSTLGSLITAYGGGGGYFGVDAAASGGGGGGGGLTGAGGSASGAASGAGGQPNFNTGLLYGGAGFGGGQGGGGSSVSNAVFGGAGGGGANTGGVSVYGGGGGGSSRPTLTAGGASTYGGAGGAGSGSGAAVAGTAPAGGGGGAGDAGTAAAGARGELRLWGIV